MSSQTVHLGKAYLRKGWSIIPVRERDKIPQIDWKPYVERRATPEELHQWVHQWPKMNLGVVTGAISGLAVVDVDSEEGFKQCEKLGIYSPVSVITTKGRHFYFKHPGERVWNSVKKIPGIDIRGDGGYVLTAPSFHPSGKLYAWAAGFASPLPYFPAQLMKTETSGPLSQSKNALGKPAGWLSEALGGLSLGNRNNTFAQIVGRLHRDRWTPGDIRSLLLPHAMRVQFPEGELDIIIGSITRYPVEIRGKSGMVDGVASVSAIGGAQQPQEPLVIRRFDKDWADYQKRITGSGVIEYGTGFPKFDKLTGGLQRGELLTVAARTETGKTNWLLRACKELVIGNKRVLFLSTEMSYERIWNRYIPLGDLQPIDHANFLVTDDFKPDLPRIAKAIETERPDVFVFDHINIVDTEYGVISQFMNGLKELARQFNIPGIVSAQLNRMADWVDPQTKHKILPRMSMIKGSGTIEETSAQVLLLHEQTNEPDHKQILGLLEKNRYGEKENIPFVLKKHPYRMEEM